MYIAQGVHNACPAPPRLPARAQNCFIVTKSSPVYNHPVSSRAGLLCCSTANPRANWMGRSNLAPTGKHVCPRATLGPIRKGLLILLFSAALWRSTTLLMSSCTHHFSATAAGAGADAEGSPPTSRHTMYLFGGDRPWDTAQFTGSDDRVRGGKSQSYLTVVDSGTSNHPHPAAEFHGNLDIKTLGGAGFASQRTIDDFPSVDLSHYDAIVLDVAQSDGYKYTITLKDEVLPKRPDGREQSTISWEYDFKVDTAANTTSGLVVLPFTGFKPTYRGKPKPDTDPLDLKNVKRISFMMRSFFGEQEGDFSIILKSVYAQKAEDEAQDGARVHPSHDVAGGGLLSWLGHLVGWRR